MKISKNYLGSCSAYTELAIFDRLAGPGPGQVYETNEDPKETLLP